MDPNWLYAQDRINQAILRERRIVGALNMVAFVILHDYGDQAVVFHIDRLIGALLS